LEGFIAMRYRWLLAPFYLLSIFTAAKSFRGNPVLGSRTLNRWGLHVLRKRVAGRIGQWRRRRARARRLHRQGEFPRPGHLPGVAR